MRQRVQGRPSRYCAIATIASGPLSSIAFEPSVWQCSVTHRLDRPGDDPEQKVAALDLLDLRRESQRRGRAGLGLRLERRTDLAVDVHARNPADDAVVGEVRAVGDHAGEVEHHDDSDHAGRLHRVQLGHALVGVRAPVIAGQLLLRVVHRVLVDDERQAASDSVVVTRSYTAILPTSDPGATAFGILDEHQRSSRASGRRPPGIRDVGRRPHRRAGHGQPPGRRRPAVHGHRDSSAPASRRRA